MNNSITSYTYALITISSYKSTVITFQIILFRVRSSNYGKMNLLV